MDYTQLYLWLHLSTLGTINQVQPVLPSTPPDIDLDWLWQLLGSIALAASSAWAGITFRTRATKEKEQASSSREEVSLAKETLESLTMQIKALSENLKAAIEKNQELEARFDAREKEWERKEHEWEARILDAERSTGSMEFRMRGFEAHVNDLYRAIEMEDDQGESIKARLVTPRPTDKDRRRGNNG